MFVRTIAATAAAAALSVAILSSGAAFAGSGFDALLADTKAAATGVTNIQAERTDRDLAGSYIAMAESLARQGNEAKALDFLNFARGKLGLIRLEPVAAAQGVAAADPVVQVGEAAVHNSAR